MVKVVVNTPPAPEKPTEPEPTIETVLEEPEVEADEALEVEATVEQEESEVEVDETPDEEAKTEELVEPEAEVEELIAAIPEIEETEEIGVDAIDVFWKERPDKTYRYDPDGNEVECGDIVLVPTRDIHNDREIVREAEVSKGNYKIDPETLDHPLKKIIGVVKRKAEKIFTSMIIPDEEKED